MVVGDASPIILFSSAGRLEVLREVIGELVVPAPVAREIEAGGASTPAASAIHGQSWIRIVDPAPIVPELMGSRLGPGEVAVLSVAFSRSGAVALLDDLAARKMAASLGIPVRGSLGVCLVASSGNHSIGGGDHW